MKIKNAHPNRDRRNNKLDFPAYQMPRKGNYLLKANKLNSYIDRN